MFGRSFHYFQIFPILLLLYAGSKQHFLFSLDQLSWAPHLLAGFSGLGMLLLSIAKKESIRKFIIFSAVLILLILMNQLIFKPSIALVTILFVLYCSLRLMGTAFLDKEDAKVKKSHLLLSFVFLVIPYLVVEPTNSVYASLCYLAFSFAGASCLYLGATYIHFKFKRHLQFALVCISILIYFFGLDFLEQKLSLILFLAVLVLYSFLLINRQSLKDLEKSYAPLFAKPEIIIVGYFVVNAFIGALFLQASVSQIGPFSGGHSFIDSFFSAICVTGLSVFDVSSQLSLFGQGIILFLIQSGGLGITTLSAWILLLLSSKRLNVGHEDAIHQLSGNLQKIDVRSLLKRIFSYFVFMEVLGASVLSCLFWLDGDSFRQAIWRGVFTSISAFCNAGFALQSDSLIPYQSNTLILLSVSFLIIAGGFAPLMVIDLPQKLKRKKLNLQDKLVLSSTAVLLAMGFLFILAVEWNHSLQSLGYLDKVVNAWFQSVTARTAGFNSVAFESMREVSQLFYLLLMFIGGNPGSTAGGVKTMTIAVLAIAALNALKESSEARVFEKRIPVPTIFRALLIVILGFAVHFLFFFALSVTQNIDSLSLLFETFSALGTVGLSVGATAELNEIGKTIIILCMLAGRVGPLTFVLLFIRKSGRSKWKVPTEEVSIT